MKKANVYEVGDLVVCTPSMAKAMGIHIHSIGIVSSVFFGLPKCVFGSETRTFLPKNIKHLEET